MPLFVSARGQDFAAGVAIDDDNCVSSVDATRFPSLATITKGMTVRSINGTLVTTAREEQTRYRTFPGEILIVLSTTVRDAFDLSSDGEDGVDGFNPQTSLPPLPSECNNATSKNSAEVVLQAARKCGPGKCLIILCESANPALPIALAAARVQTDVMYIETVSRMKTRQRMDDAGEQVKKGLQKGLWIYVEQATKSITLLCKLAECLQEVENLGKMHSKSRVFLMCEPHPHFPEYLLNDSVTLRSRLQGSNIAEVDVQEELTHHQHHRALIRGANENQPVEWPEVATAKKRVRISSEVNIVQLEKSTFLEMSASARAVDRDEAEEGLRRVARYSFGSGEKFISLCKVRDHRFAVGTNRGYVVLLDSEGLPLIQFRPHKACVWDISFASQFDFATASEDGTSAIFNYSLVGQELTATSVASFQSDVFAVTHVNSADPNSPVLSGGLSATICILHSDRQNSSFIASGTSIQAVHATQNGQVIVGGGNGMCSLIDPVTCVVRDTTIKHSRKVPAVSCHGNVAVTGGFDRMMRIWDLRSGFHLAHECPISGVVTAVAVSDKYTAVCSGSDLLMWDLRNLRTPLAVKLNAWKDLTRGLVIDGNLIVTASVDGVTRFWEMN